MRPTFRPAASEIRFIRRLTREAATSGLEDSVRHFALQHFCVVMAADPFFLISIGPCTA